MRFFFSYVFLVTSWHLTAFGAPPGGANPNPNPLNEHLARRGRVNLACQQRIDSLIQSHEMGERYRGEMHTGGQSASRPTVDSHEVEALRLARLLTEDISATVTPEQMPQLLEQKSHTIPLLREALDFIREKNIQMRFTDPSCGALGAGGLYHNPPTNAVVLCSFVGGNWANVVEILVHEVAHARQAHGSDLGLTRLFRGLPRTSEQSRALFARYDFGAEMRRHLLSRWQRDVAPSPIPTAIQQQFKALVEKLDELEALTFISPSGEDLTFRPKHPAAITQEQFFNDLDRRLVTEENFQRLTRAQRATVVPLSSLRHFSRWLALPANNRLQNSRRRDQLAAYQIALKQEYRDLRRAAEQNRAVNVVDSSLHEFYVGPGRFSEALYKYCAENQAHLISETVKIAQHWPIRDLTECRNIMEEALPKGVKQSSATDNIFHPQYRHRGDMDATIRDVDRHVESFVCSCKEDAYGGTFSKLYGFSEFRDLFRPSMCQAKPETYLPGGSEWARYASPAEIRAARPLPNR